MPEHTSTESVISYYLWVIVSPFLIIFGTIGNLICVAVMCKRSMRSSNASIYLIALALTDTCVLYTGLLRHFVKEVSDIDLRKNSNLGCKINSWMVYVSLDTSVWILVAFTFERILSVFVPHKVKSYCTRMASILVIIGVVATMMAVNGHIMYGFGDVVHQWRNTSTHYCGYLSKQYKEFFENVWPWVDFSVYNCVPFFILITGNSCIAVKVLLSRRKTRKVAVLDVTQDLNLPPTKINRKRTIKASKRTERTSSMTVILLILNCVFLLTTTPVSVYLIVVPKLEKQTGFSNNDLLDLMYTVVNLIMYINNSVNFILYCVTGSRFRKELFSLVRKQHKWILDRSVKMDQDESSYRNSPATNRQIPATQTSEVPYTVSPFSQQDTVNLTSLVIIDKDTVDITSVVIPEKTAVGVTSPPITDKEIVNITSTVIKDIPKITRQVIKDTVKMSSPVNTDIDTADITSAKMTDQDTVNSASPAITDDDNVNMTSPVITDTVNGMSSVITNANITPRVTSDIDNIHITSRVIAHIEKVNITAAVIKNKNTITASVLKVTGDESSV